MAIPLLGWYPKGKITVKWRQDLCFVKTLHARISVSSGNPTEMMITWVTFKSTVNHTVKYNVHGEPLALNATGTMTKFIDGGEEHRVLFIHKAKLTGLTPNQAYGRSGLVLCKVRVVSSIFIKNLYTISLCCCKSFNACAYKQIHTPPWFKRGCV